MNAPTQDRPREQVEFFAKVESLLALLNGTNIILSGDFNCITDVQMDRNTPDEVHPQAEQGRNVMNSLKKEWGLVDIWHISHPRERDYTFRHGSYSSRLNLFLISQQLADITDQTNIAFSQSSDPALINLLLTLGPKATRGPGFWRFSPELLTNPRFVTDMQNFLQTWTPPPEMSSHVTTWEWL